MDLLQTGYKKGIRGLHDPFFNKIPHANSLYAMEAYEEAQIVCRRILELDPSEKKAMNLLCRIEKE